MVQLLTFHISSRNLTEHVSVFILSARSRIRALQKSKDTLTCLKVVQYNLYLAHSVLLIGSSYTIQVREDIGPIHRKYL